MSVQITLEEMREAAKTEYGLLDLAIARGVNIEDLPIEWLNKDTTVPGTEPNALQAEAKAAKAKAKAEAKTEAAAAKVPGPCLCGCGETVVRFGAKFRPGHDARLNAMCIKVQSGSTDTVIPQAAIDAGVVQILDCGHPAMLGYHGDKPCKCTVPKKVATPKDPNAPKQLTGAALKAHNAKKEAAATAGVTA